MARNINGGTDRATFGGNLAAVSSTDLFAMALRFRTTQATANALLTSRWNNSSRSGYGILLNNAAGKLTYLGYDGASNLVNIAGSTTVNGGAWQTLAGNWNPASGGTNTWYVNGSSDATQNSGGAWGIGSTDDVLIGDSFDAFWPTYVGDIADVAFWHGVNLSAADIAAYHSGVAARHIKPANLRVDAPLFRDIVCRRNGAGRNVSGTTAVDHPRTFA